ncbi:MAG: hypothetical protein U1E62_01890 [Alsobacter sp.]
MNEKTLRKFHRLREAHAEAARARKEAAKKRRAIKGLGGPAGDIAALASDIGSEAVKAELTSLRAERKALKQLHAYATKAARADPA